MSTVGELFLEHKAEKYHTTMLYAQVYDWLFSGRRHITKVLEIGVKGGGSIRSWEAYFPHATIYGVDCDHLEHLETDRIKILTGRQEDQEFLKAQVIPHGPFDIIIDDGGHHSHQQQTSLLALWPHVTVGGIYAIEDIFYAFDAYYCPPGDKSTIVFLQEQVNRMICRPDALLLQGLHLVQFSYGLAILHK